jgi:adenosylhomocysteine nucleosidase
MQQPSSSSPSPLPLAVFTALSWESAAVRSALRHVRREDKRVWRGVAGQRDVLVITGGIGPRRTREVVERFRETPLGAVLSVGCAGALRADLAAGQLVLAPDIRMYATDADSQLDRFPTHPDLLAQARMAARQAEIVVAEGPLFTSPRVLLTTEEKEHHGKQTEAIAVEMESGVHAAFAQRRGLPFLPLRVILDSVGMSLPAIKGLTTPEGDVRPFKAVSRVVTHPRSLPVLLELGRVRAQAAQAITTLCRALLPVLGVI